MAGQARKAINSLDPINGREGAECAGFWCIRGENRQGARKCLAVEFLVDRKACHAFTRIAHDRSDAVRAEFQILAKGAELLGIHRYDQNPVEMVVPVYGARELD